MVFLEIASFALLLLAACLVFNDHALNAVTSAYVRHPFWCPIVLILWFVGQVALLSTLALSGAFWGNLAALLTAALVIFIFQIVFLPGDGHSGGDDGPPDDGPKGPIDWPSFDRARRMWERQREPVLTR